MAQDLDFSFEGHSVGCFEEPAYPRSAGRYRYMPYRGPGHYDMTQALAHGPVRCSFTDGQSICELVVVSVPEYGVLQVETVQRA